MANKSGGDVLQANQGGQGSLAGQDLNSVGVGGVGAVDGLGGSGAALGSVDQAIQQAQMQANAATTGDGGTDNINANTTINIS